MRITEQILSNELEILNIITGRIFKVQNFNGTLRLLLQVKSSSDLIVISQCSSKAEVVHCIDSVVNSLVQLGLDKHH